MNRSWRGSIEAALGLGLFVAALAVLRHQLRAYHLHDIIADAALVPRSQLVLALVLTAANYLVLTSYDVLGLRFIGRTLPYRRTALASFVSYVLSHNVGVSFLGGSATRFHLYSAWGLGPGEIARVVALNVLTFWVGFLALLGVALLVDGPALAGWLSLPAGAATLAGVACLTLVGGYLVLTSLRTTPLRWRRWEVPVPPAALALRQLCVSILDWVLAASVLFVLLPRAASVSFAGFVATFLLAQMTGVASQVPAGLGVFEAVMLRFLSPTVPASALLGSLLVYRGLYYLLPLLVGAALLGAHELMGQRAGALRVRRVLGRTVAPLVPPLMASATFLGGVLLLVSGAMPAARGRLAWLQEVLPLAVVEVSHFLGSLAGVGLLLVARGLKRRLDAAYVLTVAMLAAGTVLSLLKGLDYVEAAVLGVLLVALLPCRRQFYRRASLFDEPFSARWTVAVLLVVVGVGWLLLFSYRHVEYSHELWWQFTFSDAAPRSLRATVGAFVLLLAYDASRLLRPAPPDPVPPGRDDIARVRAIVAASPDTSAHLALLGDKFLLFNEARTAFIMYGIAGRSWIALRDPVSSPGDGRELAWRFRQLADRHDGRTVFYEVGSDMLSLYLDLGLTVLKLGEEGRVPLAAFQLAGGEHKSLRRTHERLGREGCRFEIVSPERVAELLPELKGISDAWLARKHTREKGFSLGFFAPAYLQLAPLAVVRHRGRIVAFANLLLAGQHEELSIDLMRYSPEAPSGLMDYLFIELILWGKAEGYRWFNLGMAPLAGLEDRALARPASRIGAFLFRHGEHFYNFRGLRQYKEKFDPVWQPRYLACPGGLALPRVLANVAALISGGLAGVVAR